jgi:hypothetical protein
MSEQAKKILFGQTAGSVRDAAAAKGSDSE